jgi:hypothetical protein
VGSSFQRAYQCEVKSCERASVIIAFQELISITEEVFKEAPISKLIVGSFEPTEGVKEVLIDPNNSGDKTVHIGTNLTAK